MSRIEAQTRKEFERAAKKVKKLGKGIVMKHPSGLRLIGEEIMLDVKMARPGKGVPVRTGALRSSGRVEGPLAGDVSLTFGGAAAPYALKVHEELDMYHRVGEARYLVRGVDRWQAHGVSARLAMAELNAAIAALTF
jgi:hypothetical protein